MKKALITIVILAAVGVGGYIWYLGNMTGDGSAPEAAAPETAVPEAVEETVDEAAEAVEATTEAVEETATEAVEETEAAAEAAAEATEEAAEDAAAAVEETAEEVVDVLSPEGFDADAVIEMIDNSSLGDGQKRALKSAVETARNSPSVAADVLAQVRSALGM